MTIVAGRYRFVAARSIARVTAHAPGHDFVASGAGIDGEVELAADHVLSVSARFPLEKLDPGDVLKTRELKRFLSLEKKPIAEATLIAPVVLDLSGTTPSGEGSIDFTIGRRRMRVRACLRGRPPLVHAAFALSFTGLSYDPPKLLFLRVKDDLDVSVQAELVLDTPLR
jgi:hypothetical protein